MNANGRTCWVVTDGKPGMENQCLGLAEAMGLAPTVKRIALRAPWKQLSPAVLRIGNCWALAPHGDRLDPPWPDVLIATGRASVAPSLHVRSASPGTFRIQIQDPAVRPSLFDLVVVPRHDRLRGTNVLVTRGALHRVTPAIVADAAARLGPAYAHLPHPRVAVLVGGSNGAYTLTPEIMADFAGKLAAMARESGAGLLVTPSRRTGAENEAILRRALAGLPAAIWDGNGENPYFALLGLADAIVATPDSVNMVCEAATTGKPVYVAELPGGSRKFDAFHQGLREDGVTRPFEGRLERWDYAPLDDTARVAAEALRRMTRAFAP
ncbi:MAG: mitochondrial fission ELM1 family protein [Magnetospirillum sp.]|nr:mitochondrial fission ELM1 family protein [Magnetospirillum sp.]